MNSPSLKLSPLHDVLEHMNPAWGRLHDTMVPISFGSIQNECEHKNRLALCDVSALPRLGLKGMGAKAWLQKNGFEIPSAIYGKANIAGDGILLRTGDSEFFIEGGIADTSVNKWFDDLASAPDVHRICRQDAAMLLSGRDAVKVLLETCGYDFTKHPGGVVMSRVAGVSCAILPQDLRGTPVLRIWCDGSFGAYLWETLLEIVRAIGGNAVGMACFFPNAFRANGEKGQTV